MCDIYDIDYDVSDTVKKHIDDAVEEVQKLHGNDECVTIPDVAIFSAEVCKCARDLCNAGFVTSCHPELLIAATLMTSLLLC